MNAIRIILVAVVAACSAPSTEAAIGDGGADDIYDEETSLGVCAPSGTAETTEQGDLILRLEDRQNFSFQSNLHIRSQDIKAGANIHFDWEALTVDMLQRAVDDTHGIDMMSVVLFSLTPDALLKKMNADALSMAAAAAAGYLYTDPTRPNADYLELLSVGGASLSEEKLLSYLDPHQYDPNEHSYTVMLAEGRVIGQNHRMIHLFRPVDGETNQTIELTNDAAQIAYSARIDDRDPILLPANRTDITLDRRESLTQDSLGRPFVPTQITDVLVAHYTTMTAAELETRFLELESAADKLFRGDVVSGARLGLSQLTDAGGTPFSGITDSGTWIVALICGNCANPAPWFLSVLETC